MQFPAMRGIIDRRILANFRVDPDVLAKVLPCPFRPKLVNGKGIAGICLIRLKQIRPRFVPSVFGISSENAAHRIAVECSAQTKDRDSDALATGEALYALSMMDGNHHEEAVRKALEFLISTQQDDGSWLVHTRNPKGHDEIVTYYGTGWATIGIIRSLLE